MLREGVSEGVKEEREGQREEKKGEMGREEEKMAVGGNGWI